MEEGTKEVRAGAFVWNINDILEWRHPKRSSNFKIGKYCYFLDIYSIRELGFTDCYVVYLNEFNRELINCKAFCKLCLMDGRNQELLVTKRTVLKFDNYIPLMLLSHSDLCCKENDSVLNLCLSWCEAQDINQERGTQTASDINSEKELSKLLLTLSEDFGRFYESNVGTDFSLRVGEEQIPVHRAVLSARSEVFAAMFRHDTSENQGGVVDIPDVDIGVLRDVFYYVYSGQTRGMSADTICPMYVVADKYALMEFRDLCLDFLMRSLTVENVCDAALLAHTHGETKLEEKVVQFVKEKLEEIEETDKWKEFLKSKSSLAFKLIRSALMIYKDEVKNLSSK